MDILQKFKEIGALLEGHFILRSGLHSRQYFQCAFLLERARLATEMCGELAEKVRGVEFDRMLSPAMGGILVGQEIARYLDKRHIFVEKVEGHLCLKRFEINRGEKIIVAEDVVTTGSAVRETLKIAAEAGAEVQAVVAIVDRSGGQPLDFGVPFHSLLELTVETFEADNLPDDLKKTEATKPGSR